MIISLPFINRPHKYIFLRFHYHRENMPISAMLVKSPLSWSNWHLDVMLLEELNSKRLFYLQFRHYPKYKVWTRYVIFMSSSESKRNVRLTLQVADQLWNHCIPQPSNTVMEDWRNTLHQVQDMDTSLTSIFWPSCQHLQRQSKVSQRSREQGLTEK